MASDHPSASGMTVLELLLAITMLMVFTGVVVMVMEVTLRFMGASECPLMRLVFAAVMMRLRKMLRMAS